MKNTDAYPALHRPRQRSETAFPLSWILLAVGASLVLVVLQFERAGLSIALNGGAIGFALAGIALLGIRIVTGRRGTNFHPAWGDASEIGFLFITTCLIGAIGSYGVASLTRGWVDGDLVLLDRQMGFDWIKLYALTSAHGSLQIAGRIAYASIYASPTMLVISFAIDGQQAAARSFLASFWLAAMTCLILFLWLPTLGPLAYMWHRPIGYMPTSGLYQAELIPLLREHRAGAIDLGHLRGLVGPPSFHAASAVLYMFAARETSNLRWPLTVLNCLMLLSIPVEGTHYAIDVVSGIAVAISCWAVVRWVGHKAT